MAHPAAAPHRQRLRVLEQLHLEDEACTALLGNVEGAPLADPRVLRFRAGRRKHSWSRNVIAVGLASGFLEPLESTSIYLAQMAITYLIELFPVGGQIDPRDRVEFNRLVDMEYDRVRDFLILHFHATTRDDSEFWNHVRTMAVPDTLAGKMALWRETGRIEKYADGLFYDASWIAVYLGPGRGARAHDARSRCRRPSRSPARSARCRTRSAARSPPCPATASTSSRAPSAWRQPHERRARAAAAVVVAGAGQVGALAAIALKRALPQAEVLVVGTPSDPAAFADRAPTALPFTNRLHDRLGIAEERLVREAGRATGLVVRYAGWGGDGHQGVAPYGAGDRPAAQDPLRARLGRRPAQRLDRRAAGLARRSARRRGALPAACRSSPARRSPSSTTRCAGTRPLIATCSSAKRSGSGCSTAKAR
jgi:hypothetical protein